MRGFTDIGTYVALRWFIGDLYAAPEAVVRQVSGAGIPSPVLKDLPKEIEPAFDGTSARWCWRSSTTRPTVVGLHRELVAAADQDGLELVAVQDHPYVPSQLDAMTLIGDLLARTRRLRFFPDVASRPLRPPARQVGTTSINRRAPLRSWWFVRNYRMGAPSGV